MTSPRALLVSLVSLATAALLLAGVPAAHADTWRHSDVAGDVLARESGSTVKQPDPTARRGDLTNLTVRYTRDALTVASSIRETNCFHDWRLRVVSSRGDVYQLIRSTSPFNSCTEPQVRVLRNGYTYACRGTTAHRTASGIVATVPRGCLDSAYRVRVGVQDSDAYGDDEAPTHVYDDALRDGRYTDRTPKLSPWIPAG